MFDEKVDNEYEEIFEQAQDGYSVVTMDERGRYESNTATESSKISTLGELFCEYYLNCPGDISSLDGFMKKEELDKIMSVDDYQKLICGDAYLPSDSLEYFRLKLPFPITGNKMHSLNAAVRLNNKAAKKLSLDINALLDATTLMRKEVLSEREKRYHEYDVRYAAEHQEENAAKAREKYHTDEAYRAKCLENSRQRYLSLSPEAREKMYQQQRDKYKTDEKYAADKRQKNAQRYAQSKLRMAQDPEYATEVRNKRREVKRLQRAKKKELEI